MSDDTISRKAAIDALIELSEQRDEWDNNEGYAQKRGIDAAICAIEDLPSAERRGQWIEEYSANHFQAKCSACGESTLYGITYDLEGNAYYMNYCPNCGARMVEDGTD